MILGLDLSLVETGVIILDNGKIVIQELIKSKPVGDKPIDELERLLNIIKKIDRLDYEKRKNGINIQLTVIEGLAFMARNTRALVQLAGLNYLVRNYFYNLHIPFVIVVPTLLKKFITGKGNAQKDLMILEIYKRFKISFENHNLADAYSLARIGEALLNKELKLTSFQQEVIEKLKGQL